MALSNTRPRIAWPLLAVSLVLGSCGGGRDVPGGAAGPRVSPAHSTDADVFQVGVGLANHDPVEAICVGGGASLCGRRVDPVNNPDAIADPLDARAIAITGANGQSTMIVTTTNIGYFLAYKQGAGAGQGIYDMRLRIADATGIPSTHIVVVSDHSHNGPDTIGIWGGVSEDYKRITADSVVAAGIAAWEARQPARLSVAAVNRNDSPLADVPRLDSSYNTPPGNDLSAGNPSNEFRVLVAEHAQTGARLATLINYAPHATVWNGVATDQVTGDWAAWATQVAEERYGGFGLATIGSVGATDWNKSGDKEARKTEAVQRLGVLLEAAEAVRKPISGAEVEVASTFIREAITQPVLLLNYKPGLPTDQPGAPGEGFDIRIDRAITPPFLNGTVFGTYVSAIRIGDVFVSTFPGEPFGELELALRQRITGPQAHFLLGAANDFFGYMVFAPETYRQIFLTGAAWLAGCPEQNLYDALGIPYDGGCADHWTLMVSPTIGQHIVCTLQDGAEAMGFDGGARDPNCAALTLVDGVLPPAEQAGRHTQ